MRLQAYLLASCFVSSFALLGCGSNQSLGSGFLEDAGAGGAGGVTSVTGSPGGATASPGGTSAASVPVGGSDSAGASAVAGQTSTTGSSNASGGSTASAGSIATGGASTSTSASAGGTTAVAGQTASGGVTTGGTLAGGSTTTGGSTSAGSGGSSGAGASGVVLTATLLDTGYIQATWKNNTQASIFLYGCGTVDVYRKESSGWTNLGPGVLCTWEGESPEVKPGATFEDRGYGPISKAWGGTGGIFRMSGKYGVGCTNPSAGQSRAGCTAFYEATSNEVTVVVPPVSDAGVDAACGAMPEGVTCRKPAGGCAAMICSNGSWACAAGQTPVALVPGSCDVPDASAGG